MLTVRPDGFSIQSSLNVFTEAEDKVNLRLALHQHSVLDRELKAMVLRPPPQPLPDLVFVANGGLWLPRLPEKVVLLSNMKHASRQRETPFLEKEMHALGIKTFRFPKTHVLEGQGEAVWFHCGKLLVVGYGYRSTLGTIAVLQRTLNRIYSKYGVDPPYVVGVKMANPSFYHLDIAMIAVSHTSCIVHSDSILHVEKLKEFVDIHVLKTSDPFVCNAVVLHDRVVTHRLKYARDKRFIEKHAQKPVVEIDASEFEKSGGSVRCMVLMLDCPHHDGVM